MNRILKLTPLLLITLLLAACPGKKQPVKPPVSTGDTVSSTSGTTSGATDQSLG